MYSEYSFTFLNTNIMATNLVPIPAGKPGKQLEINFPKIPQQKEEKKPPQTPKVPANQKGTYQSFRL